MSTKKKKTFEELVESGEPLPDWVVADHWNTKAREQLLNRKIVEVAYMSEMEKDECMWYKRPVMFKLDNGVWCYPSQDDEHNDGGALFLSNGVLPVI